MQNAVEYSVKKRSNIFYLFFSKEEEEEERERKKERKKITDGSISVLKSVKLKRSKATTEIFEESGNREQGNREQSENVVKRSEFGYIRE